MTIYETLVTIQNTSGTNDKKQILKENMTDTLELIFKDTYGKQKYYIKKIEKPNNIGNATLDENYNSFHEVLNILAKREVTGDAAYELLQNTIMMYDNVSQDILCRIIDRNLKVGISLDNFLDIVGGKENKFEVALAENLSKAKGVNPIDGTYFISRKLDGVRCICFLNKEHNNSSVKFVSRQGKEFNTLSNLIEPIITSTQSLPDGKYVLDGEICIMDDDGNENFQGLMKEVTRKDHTIINPRYNVFDLLLLDDFEGKKESIKFGSRLNRMHNNIIPNKNITILEQERVTSQDILDKWISTAKINGWEGCMLRKDVSYKRGRSKDLLKIKGMQDAEYIVTGVITGTATYNEGGHKEFDVVSAITINHKGHQVRVGSGLSKEQRINWYKNPNEIVGKTITVQYFEETQDSKTGEYSLRFPVLKHVYETCREV